MQSKCNFLKNIFYNINKNFGTLEVKIYKKKYTANACLLFLYKFYMHKDIPNRKTPILLYLSRIIHVY